MFSKSLAAAVAICCSSAAFAAEPAAVTPNTPAVAVQSAELTNAALAQQAKGILASQGFTAISELQRDENGRWTGTATKDGKVQSVAIMLPPNAAAKPK